MSLAPPVAVPRGRINLMPLYVVLFCLLWSSGFVASKIGIADCPPLLFLTIRFLIAGVLILAISVLRRDQWNLSPRDIFAFVLIGIANNALYVGLGYIGLQTISSGLNALIVSVNPMFTAALAAVFLGDQITWRRVVGLPLGVAGVAWIVADRVSAGSDSSVGIAFAIGALVALVAGTMLFKVLSPKGSLWIGNGIQNLSGGLAVAPFAFMFSDFGHIVWSGRLFASLAWLILLGSIAAFFLWFYLLTVLGATAASAYHFLMPPLGMLFGWIVLGEHVAISDLLGIVPVALGIYLVTHPAGGRGATLKWGGSRESASHYLDRRRAQVRAPQDEDSL
ncbi:MAG: DMT family transporter [Bradyrhizobium sp.]|jgi:drug/metabolite transporter (DMT)-like permease|uniref:DMT family transporter n=1 Tax=Bradyrhizobium sp. TaxID=376 RepID=UPI0012263874|nr:DMT family transporter [Bradyrhizobium sp.]THD56483.1 MAG: DMT family transporter [Bradyrhizobium sp.]